MLGGGMRQVGVLAAAGLLSLEDMTTRLVNDHKHAQYLAKALDDLPGFSVDFDHLDINMVFVKSTYDLESLKRYLAPKQILLGGYKGEYMRLVCHNDINKDDIDHFLDEVKTWLDKQT